MPDPTDPIAAADPWSRVVAHLVLSFNEETIATGTGFVARHPSRGDFLITALHNLTGREPINNKVKSRTGALPNRVTVEAYFTNFRLNLYDGENDPNSNQPLYRTHRLGSGVDITVLPVDGSILVRSYVHQSFLTEQLNSELALHVAQECYVIGFPEGLVSRPQPNVLMPVWKTGHIATEPYVDFYEGIPVLLVDSTTRRGMSGAPVIVRGRNRTRLVGIYSGRFKQPLTDNSSPEERNLQLTAELGWVFKWRVIDELIQQ